MRHTIGPKITPGSPRANGEDHLYGPGFNAWRGESGCFLSWDGGGYQGRDVTAPITEADFERLRQDPSAFGIIALAHESEATDSKR